MDQLTIAIEDLDFGFLQKPSRLAIAKLIAAATVVAIANQDRLAKIKAILIIAPDRFPFESVPFESVPFDGLHAIPMAKGLPNASHLFRVGHVRYGRWRRKRDHEYRRWGAEDSIEAR
jgi:hypothetical protein